MGLADLIQRSDLTYIPLSPLWAPAFDKMYNFGASQQAQAAQATAQRKAQQSSLGMAGINAGVDLATVGAVGALGGFDGGGLGGAAGGAGGGAPIGFGIYGA